MEEEQAEDRLSHGFILLAQRQSHGAICLPPRAKADIARKHSSFPRAGRGTSARKLLEHLLEEE